MQSSIYASGPEGDRILHRNIASISRQPWNMPAHTAEDVGFEPTERLTVLQDSNLLHYHSANLPLAEGEGVEPSRLLHSTLFKSGPVTNRVVLPVLG